MKEISLPARKCSTMAPVQQALLTLLFLSSVLQMSSAQIETIENKPLDGHKFLQGQSFRIECRSFTSQDFAIRLACPLAEYASGGLASTSCFENCGRPLCDQPNLNDCSKTLPELLVANCSRSVKQTSATWQEISIVFTFNLVNPRHSGSYMCQFKNLRSSSYIIVDPIVTTTMSTTTSTTTTSTSTTSSTTTAPTTTKSTVPTTSKAGMSTTKTSSTVSTASVSKTTAQTTLKTTEPLRPESSSTEKIYTLPPGPKTQPVSTGAPGEPTTSDELTLNSAGWFYSSIVGTLSGADVILICLLIMIAAAWLIGFFCIRSQVLTKTGTPTTRCCSVVLCLCQQHQQQQQQKYRRGPQTINGGLREFAEQERRQGAVRLTAMSSHPTAASANSVSSGQVYSEPDGMSYYSPDVGDGVLHHPLVLAGGGMNGSDDYYRLQQDFDDPLSRGGYGTNPRSTFFPRDQTGRHSFQSARPAARHRPSIPQQMLLDTEETDAEAEAAADLVAAAVDPVMTREDFRRQMEQQRREIASLRQQLRDSQLQLNHKSSAAAAKQPQQAPQQQQSPISGDYDLLSRVAAAETVPPSPPPPPPPQQQQKQSVSQSITDDSDLPPLPPPPMVDEAVENELENRRGSLGRAYGTGQRY